MIIVQYDEPLLFWQPCTYSAAYCAITNLSSLGSSPARPLRGSRGWLMSGPKPESDCIESGMPSARCH